MAGIFWLTVVVIPGGDSNQNVVQGGPFAVPALAPIPPPIFFEPTPTPEPPVDTIETEPVEAIPTPEG